MVNSIEGCGHWVKCIEANPFVRAKGTGTELLWKVTPVHCYIEFCLIGDISQLKMAYSLPIFNWPIQHFEKLFLCFLGMQRYLKWFSWALRIMVRGLESPRPLSNLVCTSCLLRDELQLIIGSFGRNEPMESWIVRGVSLLASCVVIVVCGQSSWLQI